ncbi:hypothetical protein WN943_000669 [Citrus x changshan-huyou]
MRTLNLNSQSQFHDFSALPSHQRMIKYSQLSLYIYIHVCANFLKRKIYALPNIYISPLMVAAELDDQDHAHGPTELFVEVLVHWFGLATKTVVNVDSDGRPPFFFPLYLSFQFPSRNLAPYNVPINASILREMLCMPC